MGCLVSDWSYSDAKTTIFMWKLKLSESFLKRIVIIYCSWLDQLLRDFSKSRKRTLTNYQGAILWRYCYNAYKSANTFVGNSNTTLISYQVKSVLMPEEQSHISRRIFSVSSLSFLSLTKKKFKLVFIPRIYFVQYSQHFSLVCQIGKPRVDNERQDS